MLLSVELLFSVERLLLVEVLFSVEGYRERGIVDVVPAEMQLQQPPVRPHSLQGNTKETFVETERPQVVEGNAKEKILRLRNLEK